MHCSRCGANVSDELNFCSSCGERVNMAAVAETVKKQQSLHDNLATMACVIGGGGLLFLVGLIAVLTDKPIPVGAIVAMVGMYLAAWLIVMLKLIGPFLRIVDAEVADKKLRGVAETDESAFLPPRGAAVLPEFREPASVTERTTRTLDEVKVGRNT